jgi:hypothetical protein
VNWTAEQLAEYEEKQRRWDKTSSQTALQHASEVEADPGPESDLQSKCETYCEDHGYPFFHDRSRGCNEPGFVDLVVALPRGRTLWLELKSKNGRLSSDQQRWRRALLYLGHSWHSAHSYRRFLEIVADVLAENPK